MADTTQMSDDERRLAELGYKQELNRNWSGFSNFAISFSIICILSGGINSLGQATSGVGGAAIGIGWLVGCVLSGPSAGRPAEGVRRAADAVGIAPNEGAHGGHA